MDYIRADKNGEGEIGACGGKQGEDPSSLLHIEIGSFFTSAVVIINSVASAVPVIEIRQSRWEWASWSVSSEF